MRATLFSQLKSRNSRAESAKSAPRNMRVLDNSLLKQNLRQKRLNISEDFGPLSAYENSYRNFDKEKMEQEQYYLKNQMNQFQEENVRLRTKVRQLEDCCQQKDKILVEIEKIGSVKAQFQKQIEETNLVTSLKRQINEMREKLNQKEIEITNMKKNLKYTSVKEIQVEKEKLQEETLRLKQQLEAVIQASLFNLQQNNVDLQIQDKMLQMISYIQQIKSAKRESDKTVLRLKKQCMQYKTSQLDCEYRSQREIRKLKEIINEKNKEIEQYKPNKRNEELQEQVTRQQKEIQSYKEQIELQKNYIEDLERRLMKTEQESAREELISSNKDQMELSKTQNILEFASQQQQENNETNPTPKSLTIREQIKQTVVIEKKQKKRIIPISYQDVKLIGDTLKYRLMAMQIDLNDIEQFIFDSEMNQNGFSTYIQLKGQLQKYPFDLNSKEAQLIARYIIENDQEQVTDLTQQYNPYVKSVMRRLVNNYQLQNVLNAFSDKVYDTLTRSKQFLVNTILQIAGQKATRISKEQFIDAITMLQLELNTFEIDYLIVQGIMESENITSLNFQEMLKYEETDQHTEENFMITQQVELQEEEQDNQSRSKQGQMSVIEEQDAEKGSLDEFEFREDSKQSILQDDEDEIEEYNNESDGFESEEKSEVKTQEFKFETPQQQCDNDLS